MAELACVLQMDCHGAEQHLRRALRLLSVDQLLHLDELGAKSSELQCKLPLPSSTMLIQAVQNASAFCIDALTAASLCFCLASRLRLRISLREGLLCLSSS